MTITPSPILFELLLLSPMTPTIPAVTSKKTMNLEYFAIDSQLAAKFRNSGQTCVCANRILVQEGIYDKFANALLDAVQSMKVGDGFSEEAKALGMALGVSCLNGIEEAEAQCALLNSESLCDGCFSSDSDIFLFGARTVYREICLGDGGYVVCYEMAEIENKLGLGWDSLIALSLLLGSDYHQGVHDSNFKPFKLVFTTKICNGTKADEEEAFSGVEQILMHNIGKDDTILQVIDAYLKPKCHSADSDFVLKAHSQYPFQRTKLHHICAVYFEWPSERT
ncbi:hypothetical protein RYX36_019386, partial [Vicia faba]